MFVIVSQDGGVIDDTYIVDTKETLRLLLKSTYKQQGVDFYNGMFNDDFTDIQRMMCWDIYCEKYEYEDYEIHVKEIDNITTIESLFDRVL